MKTSKKPLEYVIERLHAWDRRTRWAFHPFLPAIVALSINVLVALTCGLSTAEAGRDGAILAASGAVMICCGLWSLARPMIRVGGWGAYHERLIEMDASSSDLGLEQLQEQRAARNDTLSVQVVGPVLAISGTLLNGFSGLIGIWIN